jgi:hypothetical protein
MQLKDKVDPTYQHDFDHIKQDSCQYGKKKVLIRKCIIIILAKLLFIHNKKFPETIF